MLGLLLRSTLLFALVCLVTVRQTWFTSYSLTKAKKVSVTESSTTQQRELDGIVVDRLYWPRLVMETEILVESRGRRYEVQLDSRGHFFEVHWGPGTTLDGVTIPGVPVRIRYQPGASDTIIQPISVTRLPLRPNLTDTSTVLPNGIGPVRFGMTVFEAAVAAGIPFRRFLDTSCDRWDLKCWEEMKNCHYASPEGYDGVIFEVRRDTIVSVTIHDPRFRTARGIHTHDTEQHVRAIYPMGEFHPAQGEEPRGLVVRPVAPNRQLVFIFSGGQLQYYEVGRIPRSDEYACGY